jgi:hypothetical protein
MSRLLTWSCDENDTRFTATEWNIVTGSAIAPSTNQKHSGTRAYRVNPSAASAFVQRNLATTLVNGDELWMRKYLASAPSSGNAAIFRIRNSGNTTVATVTFVAALHRHP